MPQFLKKDTDQHGRPMTAWLHRATSVCKSGVLLGGEGFCGFPLCSGPMSNLHGTRRCYAQFGSKSNAAMQVTNPTQPNLTRVTREPQNCLRSTAPPSSPRLCQYSCQSLEAKMRTEILSGIICTRLRVRRVATLIACGIVLKS